MTTARIFLLKKIYTFTERRAIVQSMAQPLLIAHLETATIEELKQVCRVGSNQTDTRWFNNHVCKNEEKLLERLHQAILDVIDNPLKTQQTTAIGTLF